MDVLSKESIEKRLPILDQLVEMIHYDNGDGDELMTRQKVNNIVKEFGSWTCFTSHFNVWVYRGGLLKQIKFLDRKNIQDSKVILVVNPTHLNLMGYVLINGIFELVFTMTNETPFITIKKRQLKPLVPTELCYALGVLFLENRIFLPRETMLPFPTYRNMAALMDSRQIDASPGEMEVLETIISHVGTPVNPTDNLSGPTLLASFRFVETPNVVGVRSFDFNVTMVVTKSPRKNPGTDFGCGQKIARWTIVDRSMKNLGDLEVKFLNDILLTLFKRISLGNDTGYCLIPTAYDCEANNGVFELTIWYRNQRTGIVYSLKVTTLEKGFLE